MYNCGKYNIIYLPVFNNTSYDIIFQDFYCVGEYKLNAVGIIAEFNPFHLGHKYLLDRVADDYDCVVCVLSGNFVQRGDVSIISKQARTKMALYNGADLVIELPVAWSMTTAQNFALGGVSLLKNLGCVDAVAFGSECGNIEQLKTAAEALNSPGFKSGLEAHLNSGKTFAAARQEALNAILHSEAELLTKPNNTLAAEYIGAADRIGYKPEFVTFKRLGADHNALSPTDETASAELIRSFIKQGNLDGALDYMDEQSFGVLYNEYKEGRVADIDNIQTAVIANLRLANKREFANLPDLSEGIENRLISFVKSASSLEELYKLVKTKRYTMARIRRLVLSAFLQIDNSFFGKEPPYIKVLGFNPKGEQLLKRAAKTAKAPIVCRSKDVSALDSFAQSVFDCECRATDIFALSTATPLPCGLEYTEKIIKV